MNAEAALKLEQDDGPKVGIFADISNEDYHHGSPGISKSGLDLINKSPAHFKVMKQHPKPPTPAMDLGTAFHTIILEPERFEQEFVPDPFPGSYSKAAKEAREMLFANGQTTIQTAKDAGFWGKDDWRTLHRMRDAVMNHPLASVLLDPDQGEAELSCYWVDPVTYKLCKCRPDFINHAHNVAIDLKSTEDASFTGFGKSCGQFRYFVQDAFYSDGLKEAGKRIDAFVFIAVEKVPPYGVGVYTLRPEEKRIGRIEYRRNLDLYARCMKEDDWPSYPEEIRDLAIPPWGLKGHIR